MKIYIGLQGFPQGKGIGWEYKYVSKSPEKIGQNLYILSLDGHETGMIEFDTVSDKARLMDYREKFAYGKPPFPGYALRPDDV